ncbi:MAG: biosynthetic-type acetolactate synthase large subunit [Firmicutes bacterium]|nr:biosynthetic-type acetolactate synthase large subunit [Bacillota bacterium]
MTGAEMVVKTLEKNGVKVVFGYPGASNCPIIDRLSFSSIKHILTRNEQGAAHMASGYARVTKTAGVCTATSGPGATNLITGIATAYMDSVPMVALTGQVISSLIGKDAFQEVDITGATLPFTKHSYLIKDGLEIPKVVNEAFHIANTGRPGPVLIDFPMDILKAEFDYPEEDEEVSIRGYKLIGKANESQVKKVAEAIKGAKKPVILAGGGIVISDAVNEFRKFVKETNIPVVSTMMGIGTLPTDNPRYYGMIGSHGVKRANMIFNRADLVIVMGSRLGDRTVANVKGLEQGNKLIHIDIDPAEIGKNVQPYIPVVGDIKDVLEQLTPQITGFKADKQWIEEADELRSRFTHKPFSEDNGYVNPRYFLNVLSEKTNSDVYISTEVGQNQIWCANNFKFTSPRSLLTSGGFGTMGYGLPAAIGASVAAAGSKPVIAVMGDGSFQMDLPEMGTMMQWDIPVKMVLFQNHRLGMVHEHQFLLYKSNYQAVTIDGKPDFAMLAKAYGIDSGVVTENSGVEAAIDKMMAADGSYLLVVNVSPFEPTGDALNEATLPKKEDN